MTPETRLSRLLEELASDKPAPAGGSASAAVVAVAAALLEKVAQLSTRHWKEAERAQAQARQLRLHAEELVERDVHAYLGYVAALRSKSDIEAARSLTIDVPLEVARAAVQVVDLAQELGQHGNRNLRPDATTAAILAHAAISASAMMVQVNVGLHVSDARLQEALKQMRAASESVRRLGAPGLAGVRDRAPARSRDSDSPSARRRSRGDRSAGAARRSAR